ncbi:MAG: hypothetical protein PVH11_08955 [Anaerolineae bacterium]|jgi:hypothetical protein
MSRRLLLLLTAIVLALTVPLALLFRDFVRDVFLVELLRMFWGARLLYESLPQLPLWILLLLLLVVIALRSLVRRPGTVRQQVEPDVEPQGQVRVLARWIERASRGEYFRWSLAQHLGGLAWEIMAQREHTTPAQLKGRRSAGDLDLPPVVEAYLLSDQLPRHSAMASLLATIRDRLGIGGRPLALDPDLVQVIEFLEDQMQVVNVPDEPNP